jgi:ribulose-5-phosphate 4-epimerase/fuculose-1-phosphate aldolase
MQPIRTPSPVEQQVSPEEWQARVDLAALYRLTALYQWDDLVFTHISMRVPGPEHHFLINPYGFLFEEITASSLVKVDLKGSIVMETPHFINPAGFTIHSAVHEAREDALCVFHTHTQYGVAVSAQKDGLLPISQQSLFPLSMLGYHDYEGLALNEDEKPRLVADLGRNQALILRNHGLLTTGATIPEAFNAMHRLELSCKTQIAAMSCNTKLIEVPADVVHATYMNFQPHVRRPFGVMDWPALLRKLDRIDPGFRD